MWSNVFLLLSVTANARLTTAIEDYYKIDENLFLFDEHPIAKKKAYSLMVCSQLCSREDLCNSANFMRRTKTCELLKTTARKSQPEKMSRREGFHYLEKALLAHSRIQQFYFESGVPNSPLHSEETISLLGSSRDYPALNCRDLQQRLPSVKSGTYWIDPSSGSHSDAFQAYCDQETQGGGWTLVWSYTFTDYDHFNTGANAVTPRPSWRARLANTQVSTTAPLNETKYGALNFSLWYQIGNQTLIKSNINNWVFCDAGTGSLMHYTPGVISCTVVKQVASICTDVAPTKVSIHDFGPSFGANNLYYYFDGSTNAHWPTHDPCGTNKPNHLTNVDNPHGNVFLR